MIKVGDTYDKVSDERGQPVYLNGKGDVIYTSADSKTMFSPRMRWRGKLYPFTLAEWSRISRYQPYSTSTGLPTVVDMNESGQVLFVGPPSAFGFGSPMRAYLATPSLTPVSTTP